MKLIVGLGNPGRTYEKTRHNVGFMVLNKFSEELGKENFKFNKRLNGEIIKDTKFVLMKPQNFMNNSGDSVFKASSFYKIEPRDVYVIHDEFDIPFGDIRKSFGSGSAGHNGVQSVIEQLGTKDFGRLRIGIKSSKLANPKAEDFVLERFTKEEERKLPEIIERAVAELKEII